MTGNIKLAGFEIRKIDRKEMMIGLALIALSFLMPVLFTVQNFQVREYMHLALEKQEKTDLMVAALRLVMLNALRAAPHYIGAYYIAESVELYRLYMRALVWCTVFVTTLVCRLCFWVHPWCCFGVWIINIYH